MTNPVPLGVIHADLAEAQWVEMPEVGGAVWMVSRSADNTSAVAVARESGAFSFTYPFHEFYVVLRGSGTVTVGGTRRIELAAGNFGFFPEGATAEFDLSADYMHAVYIQSSHGPLEL